MNEYKIEGVTFWVEAESPDVAIDTLRLALSHAFFALKIEFGPHSIGYDDEPTLLNVQKWDRTK